MKIGLICNLSISGKSFLEWGEDIFQVEKLIFAGEVIEIIGEDRHDEG